ncbi:YqcI/YcgG family protein [Streptomyces sp. NPDC005955]|uniref:YqcI/YcgG family protein n=1 Tax=Streptomyces sp. NPDC005955 TaxID=3364738 RepID=UPI0036830DA7
MAEAATTRLWVGGERAAPRHTPRWAQEERQRVRGTLLGAHPSPYPCHFGSIGENRGTNHYTYWDLHQDFASEAQATARALRVFIEMQLASPDERLSLLILAGPPSVDADFAWYRDLFWRMLSTVHEHDQISWPVGTLGDPEDPNWEFTFAGEPLFTFGTCPAYGPRRSRVLGECLVIGVQCRRVFDSISGSTAAGRAAKKRIRQSLAEYESVPVLEDAGDGQGSTLEKWKQYFPEVDGKPLSGKCPVQWEKR